MTASAPSLRLFYALWPDDASRAALVRLQPSLAGRHTHPADLHLTLAFLGAQPADRLPTLREILRALPATKFDLLIDRIGYFPNSRIAWAGMAGTPAGLASLREALLTQLAGQGIDMTARGSFTPHITLARNAPWPEPASVEPIPWRPERVVLVESAPQQAGTHYRIVD